MSSGYSNQSLEMYLKEIANRQFEILKRQDCKSLNKCQVRELECAKEKASMSGVELLEMYKLQSQIKLSATEVHTYLTNLKYWLFGVLSNEAREAIDILLNDTTLLNKIHIITDASFYNNRIWFREECYEVKLQIFNNFSSDQGRWSIKEKIMLIDDMYDEIYVMVPCNRC